MPKVEEMFAFIAEDPLGDEGIVAMPVGRSGFLPMIGADMKRIESIRAWAQIAADERGKTVRLVRFHQMEVLEEIKPQRRRQATDE